MSDDNVPVFLMLDTMKIGRVYQTIDALALPCGAMDSPVYLTSDATKIVLPDVTMDTEKIGPVYSSTIDAPKIGIVYSSTAPMVVLPDRDL